MQLGSHQHQTKTSRWVWIMLRVPAGYQMRRRRIVQTLFKCSMLMLRQYASVINAVEHVGKPITPNTHTHCCFRVSPLTEKVIHLSSKTLTSSPQGQLELIVEHGCQNTIDLSIRRSSKTSQQFLTFSNQVCTHPPRLTPNTLHLSKVIMEHLGSYFSNYSLLIAFCFLV